jgi:hypothetical protein
LQAVEIGVRPARQSRIELGLRANPVLALTSKKLVTIKGEIVA